MTAVQWLANMLEMQGTITPLDISQAEKMEKQQIIDAHGSKLRKSKGTTNYEYWYTGEQYYNETFKNTKK
jgi:hypothetical protein